MKPKRKEINQKAEVHIPFPMLLANILVFVAVIGLSYVWLCARCDSLGREINRLETVSKEVRLRVISEQDRWANLLAPSNFERALKRHNLVMSLPEERQIVRIRQSRTADAVTLAYRK